MKSNKFRITYLFLLNIFLIVAGFFWLDYIGLINLRAYKQKYFPEKKIKAVEAKSDDLNLIRLEEIKKSRERIEREKEELALRKLNIEKKEKEIERREEKIKEKEKGLLQERKRLDEEKKEYHSYKKNIDDLAMKIGSMPPEGAIKIMDSWDDLLIIDVLRRMDKIAQEEGRQSITSYLLYLIQKQNPKRASSIMRKMAQIVPEDS